MSEREKLIEVMARAMLADELAVRPTLTFHPTWEQESDIWLSNARAALTALEAAGVRLVPVEATEEMVERGDGRMRAWIPMPTYKGEYSQVLQDAYRSMLAASPYAPEGTRNDHHN